MAVEGYGTSKGVAMHRGKWLNEVGVVRALHRGSQMPMRPLCAPLWQSPQLDVHRKLTQVHPVLKRSQQLRAASGRYSVDAPVIAKEPAFKKLRTVTTAEFESFLTSTVKPSQLAFVACVREDDPHCRRVTQVRLLHCLVGSSAELNKLTLRSHCVSLWRLLVTRI